MISLQERARRYLRKCPPAISGQRGHHRTYRMAATLVNDFGLDNSEALSLLREWNYRCRPPWTEAELIHKIQSAASRRVSYPPHQSNWQVTPHRGVSQSFLQSKAGPHFRLTTLKRIASKLAQVDAYGLLSSVSPVRVSTLSSADVLHMLYGTAKEKVLVFSDLRSQGQLLWDAGVVQENDGFEMPSGQDGAWFLPQPVDGLFHPNPRMGGRLSRRSEESVTSWRYLVLESDEAPPDDWLRCIVQMPLRVSCICESGRRSIHVLVRIDAVSKADWDAIVGGIKPIVLTLGVDPAALTAIRLTRLPQAMRGGRIQRLLYLNPAPKATPIWFEKGHP